MTQYIWNLKNRAKRKKEMSERIYKYLRPKRATESRFLCVALDEPVRDKCFDRTVT